MHYYLVNIPYEWQATRSWRQPWFLPHQPPEECNVADTFANINTGSIYLMQTQSRRKTRMIHSDTISRKISIIKFASSNIWNLVFTISRKISISSQVHQLICSGTESSNIILTLWHCGWVKIMKLAAAVAHIYMWWGAPVGAEHISTMLDHWVEQTCFYSTPSEFPRSGSAQGNLSCLGRPVYVHVLFEKGAFSSPATTSHVSFDSTGQSDKSKQNQTTVKIIRQHYIFWHCGTVAEWKLWNWLLLWNIYNVYVMRISCWSWSHVHNVRRC